MARSPRRGEVHLVQLDPARGQEIRKLRPCVVVSPDEMNRVLPTVIVAPMTTGSHAYPFRVPCTFQGKDGHVVPEQVRTVARARLVRRLGRLDAAAVQGSLGVLREMFEE